MPRAFMVEQFNLQAFGSLTLEAGSLLSVAAQEFNHAGKGGAITLEAGSQVDGVIDTNAILDLEAGAIVNLSVAQQQFNQRRRWSF